MDVVNKNCLIVGLGISGVSAAKFLHKRGAKVVATDIANEETLKDTIASLRNIGITVECGYHRPETFEWADIIVLSPGVPHTLPEIIRAKQKGALVIGEIELACRFIYEPILAITGTNGKTTVTSLIGKMLKSSGISVFVGGNIGNALIDYVDSGLSVQWIVAEISSFQLDTIINFRPTIGVLLNITEDHLDRYPDFQSYVLSKGRLFENQSSKDIAVLNNADPAIRSISTAIKSRKLWYYSKGGPLSSKDCAIINNHRIIFRMPEIGEWEFDMSQTKLRGTHNAENIAAACLASFAAGGTPEGILSTLTTFQGLPHRIEFVAEKNGVKFYDDSKGTNIDAVVRALEGFDDPVILIMGGRDKGSPFHILEESIRRHVKKLVLIGESKYIIQKSLGHITETELVDSMKEAVETAYRSASPGDIVLLSPACASFDMYRNYSERGKAFCHAVHELI